MESEADHPTQAESLIEPVAVADLPSHRREQGKMPGGSVMTALETNAATGWGMDQYLGVAALVVAAYVGLRLGRFL